MKKNKFLLFIIIILIPHVTACGGEVREALEGKKRSDQSDEFLVKKKNPLQMPPDISKLPEPGDSLEENTPDSKEKDDVKKLLKLKESKSDVSSETKSDLLKNMKKKIQ